MNKETMKHIMLAGTGIFNTVEAIFIIAAPVYLYGWMKGLLISSALTSIFGTCQLIKRMYPVVIAVARAGEAMARTTSSKIVRP